MKKDAPMDTLDPARTALVVVHMVKGVAGEVDTPFNRIFRPRAEKTGIIGVQARLLEGFRTGKAKSNAKVVDTAVTYQPGYPGVTRNSRLFRTLIDNGPSLLLEGTPAVEVIDDLAPRPGEPVVRGQGANGFDRTELDSILRQAGVDTLVLVGIATDVAVESTARAACDLGYRTIVVTDACTADSDEAHSRSLDVHRAWFGETATADEVLGALGASSPQTMRHTA
jgi:nicotinamidase-related amidase